MRVSHSLIAQATDRSGRYKLGSASQLKVGDIVLMREDNMKRADFPMARNVELHYNFLGEVNEEVLMKDASRELVKRHLNTCGSCEPIDSNKTFYSNKTSFDLM